MNKKVFFSIFIIVLVLIGYFWISIANSKNITGNVFAYSGNSKIDIKGSDTLLQLVSNLAEEYSKENEDVKISVTGGGSGTGIASLINGEIDIADSSRPIKDDEKTKALEKGYDVVEVIIGRDMLSVITNKNNPVKRLSIDQLSKIYKGEIENWKELGGNDEKITLYGRQSSSGTYVFFLEHVVKGEYDSNMRNMEGNQVILDAIKQDKTGIGYIGLGYISDENGNKVSGINVIEVSDGNSDYISPLDKSKILDYPLSRPLVQYLSKKPVKNSEEYNFIMFELSDKGQEIVKQSGFDKILPSDKQKNDQILTI